MVLTLGAAVVAADGFTPPSRGGGQAPAGPPATARVTRQTLVDTYERAGDLGYGARITLTGRIGGVVTRLPLPGDVIGRGQAVYRVDDTPVVLLFGAVVAYRTLTTGVVGADVRQLEDSLRALGYGGFTVDDTYSAGTAAAVRAWQRDLGLPRTGEVQLGRVLFAPGEIRVDSVTTGVNRSTGGGEDVLQYTGTGRLVTVLLDVSRQRLARKGVEVRVLLPDGQAVPGRLERVSTVVEQPATPDAQPQTKLEAVVSLADPAAAARLEAAVVTVVFTAAARADVLTVPVAALVALAEGGYGVEVVLDGTATRHVRVETGLFAGGRVEISGDGLRDGTTVVMPA
ncbi:peptidoglycan-binding protein [Dactylosporangium aurantiacum]|uniref:Peptidoglycan-binding protein n=1 Tax=Dactylosporangium aurantiacum TaxID=35754 RepID=A0A9Q9MNV6_9ACTN|nr:peptidoglycan-binding protein [Dactylosporangium aurantiacum]